MNQIQIEGTFPPSTNTEPTVALTIDVEDYFMSPECIPDSEWDSFPSCIHLGMERTLQLLDRYKVHATFFFLGWLAERYPELVSWSAEKGHEIATHTYDHRFVSTLTPEQYAESVRRSVEILRAQAPHQPIYGHRAPAFSLDRQKRWQFEILRENGLVYDSSLNPHATYLYGDRQANRFPHTLHDLVEFPPGAIEVVGKRFPVGGGGTLRILPEWYLHWARRRYQKEGYIPVIYIHPWELVPEHPRIRLPWKLRKIHWTGIHSLKRKVCAILEQNRCVTLHEYYTRCKNHETSNTKAKPAGISSTVGSNHDIV